ncbi:MAG: GGDEF domain-containing protein [Gammaproteobacteria bacterium]|nr:GGDEF domain-containing protein [Gammaproteobacteria bacterium]
MTTGRAAPILPEDPDPSRVRARTRRTPDAAEGPAETTPQVPPAIIEPARAEDAHAPGDIMSRTVGRFWALFVVGILVAAAAFTFTTWRELTHAAARRLAFAASAAARHEAIYLNDLNGRLIRLGTAIEQTPSRAAAQKRLAQYRQRHPQDDVRLIPARQPGVLARMPWTQSTQTTPTSIQECVRARTTCLSIPEGRGGLVAWMARPLGADRILLLRQPVAAWPHLSIAFHFAGPGTHIFLLNTADSLSFRISRSGTTEPAAHGTQKNGPLMRTLQHHPQRVAGIFQGRAGVAHHWRLGAYHRTAYGLVIGISTPLPVLLATLGHRLAVPLVLITLLLALGTLYHRFADIEVRRAHTVRLATDHRLRHERAFAEQQRDFYQALSELTRLIAHHPAPERLFQAACRIIMAYTDLLFVWAGQVEASGDIRVVSYAEKGPLDVNWLRLRFTSDPSRPEGRGPAGRCVRSGQIEISENVQNDQGFSSWRSVHEHIGTGSAAAVPILRNGRVVAVLAFGSRHKALFLPLIHLLERFARNIAFSLEDHDREQSLRYQAHHDALTGLYNRTHFQNELQRHLTQSPDGPLAIAILDLDGFKVTNDQYGHHVGDQLLLQISERLRTLLPPLALAARLGGDEFAVILLGVTAQDEVTDLLDTIRWGLEPPCTIAAHGAIHVTATIGIAVCPQDGRSASDLIRRAGQALHEAKGLGHSSAAFFRPELEQRLIAYQQIQDRFAQDLAQHRLILHFQPQVEIATGHIRSAEALIRWPQSDGTIWTPDRYFPAIAHNAELMRALDLFVLKEALATVRTLEQDGCALPIAVNIHSQNLLHPEFARAMRTILAAHTDLTRLLEIEVTESSPLTDLDDAGRALAACRALGVTVALDDFGTGYASLNYLQKLPCDYIKIDRAFVTGMAEDMRDFAIVSATVAAATVLGIHTVAEGVEHVEQGLLLRDLGCRYVQGYVVSRPVPPAALRDWLATWRAPAASASAAAMWSRIAWILGL